MDGGIRVPTLIRWPAQIEPQLEIDVPLSNMDFLPIVAEVAGVKLPTDRLIDGVSMLPLLTGTKEERKREYFIHYCSEKIYAVRFNPDQGNFIDTDYRNKINYSEIFYLSLRNHKELIRIY